VGYRKRYDKANRESKKSLSNNRSSQDSDSFFVGESGEAISFAIVKIQILVKLVLGNKDYGPTKISTKECAEGINLFQ
jgi:hypothetical protein